MSDIYPKEEEILKSKKFWGLAFYRVTQEGQFMECDAKARKIFGIPEKETNITKYSIKDLYLLPEERNWRIKRLLENKHHPLSSAISIRVNGKNKLLFDMCRYDESYPDNGNFVGFVSEIENGPMFPEMLETFPMGMYTVDDESRIVRANKKFTEILKYENERTLLNKPIKELCDDENEQACFNREIERNNAASGILRLKDADNEVIEVECFSQRINELEKAHWGMINDVTELLRYSRTFEKMPTGFYHVEYEKSDKERRNERLAQCNDRFAQILGFKKKEDAIGINISKLLHPEVTGEKFLLALYKADKRGEPLLNYPFESKTIDGRTIHISIDAHLVKDRSGNVIGREGTIRDITEEMELKAKVDESQENLKVVATDINKLIHKFFHPILKFAGNAQTLYQMGSLLQKTIKPEEVDISDTLKLGEELKAKLLGIEHILSTIDENTMDDDLQLAQVDDLEREVARTINVLDHSLKTEIRQTVLDNIIRNTAFRILDELYKIEYFVQTQPDPLIKADFIEFIQGILFRHLLRGAKMLKGETQILKRELEALRTFMGLEKERKYIFKKGDIGKMVEENIELFDPIFSEKKIKVVFKRRGELTAEVSKNDIERIISNLFHNVSNYAYEGEGRFVKVRAREMQPQNEVEISVESYGTPIKKEEIESCKLFNFGERGEKAYKNHRDGTGVGLADAKKVVDAHGGKISIKSVPTDDDGDPPQYKVPYLTTVTLRIPRKRQ